MGILSRVANNTAKSSVKVDTKKVVSKERKVNKTTVVDLSAPYEPPSHVATPVAKEKNVVLSVLDKANSQSKKASPNPNKKSIPPKKITENHVQQIKKKKTTGNGWSGTSILSAMPPNLLFGENFKVPKLLKN